MTRFHGVRAFHDTTQTLVDTDHTIVALNSTDYDTDGYHDNSSNNHRLTVPADSGLAGYYHIFGAVSTAPDAAGQRLAVVCLNEPGALTLLGTQILVPVGEPTSSGTANTHLAFATVRYLDEGDFVDMRVYQDSGGDIDLDIGSNPGDYVPSFGMRLVGRSIPGVWMDFDEDGFVGTDDVTSDVMSWRIQRGVSGDLTGATGAGSFTVTLKDPDGLYNPSNATGPLYGLLRDGLRCWIGVNEDGTVAQDPDKTVYGLAAGRCTDITPIPAGGADVPPMVEFVFEDPLSWIGRAATSLADSTSRSHYELRKAILDDIGETLFYDLEPEPTTMPISSVDGLAGNALDSINAANGTRHFAKPAADLDDWYAYTSIRRTSQLDGVADASIDFGTDHATDTSGWRTSADTVINRQRASVTPIILGPGAVPVWEQEPLPLTVTGTLTLWPEFADFVGSAVVNLSYSGSALTAILTPFGHSAKLVLASAGTSTVEHLTIDGYLVERGQAVTVQTDDTSSQALPRGIRAGPDLSGDLLGTESSARAMTAALVWRFADPLVRPTLTVTNWLPEQFAIDLTDVIGVTSSQLATTDRLFDVVGLEHQGDWAAAAGKVSHTVVYQLQESKVQTPTSWFTTDVSTSDGPDVLAY